MKEIGSKLDRQERELYVNVWNIYHHELSFLWSLARALASVNAILSIKSMTEM